MGTPGMKKYSVYNCATGIINVLYRDENMGLIVRTSSITDMLLIDKLQKENAYAVGFIQKSVWEKYVFGGERNFVVFICEANNDPVGYVLITPGRKPYSYAKIQQIAIRNDARRLHYGAALISVCRKYCIDNNRIGFTLRCRIDLESNNFWKSLGFKIYDIWEKGKINHVGFKASDDINLWKIELNNRIFTLFDMDEDSDLRIFNKSRTSV
jgi:hypothetical protein